MNLNKQKMKMSGYLKKFTKRWLYKGWSEVKNNGFKNSVLKKSQSISQISKFLFF